MINPLMAIDFYKADHRSQYPEGTEYVYSNFTPRADRLANTLSGYYDNSVVFFGLQYFIKDFLIKTWDEEFFNADKDMVISAYKKRMDKALGPDAIDTNHIAALHDLGYLPIIIKAVKEGQQVPIGVPVLTVINTHPEFFWLTNYLESVISTYMWKPITSATTANQYKKLLTHYAEKTGGDLIFVNFQAHDFSFRGMSGLQDSMMSGAAHLTSFWVTDTVLAIDFLEEYYGAADCDEPVGMSVPATEHSVMCMGTEEGEIDTFKRLITKIYPSGIVSIVSDTWDFWKVLGEYLPELKETILEREGKVVIRPDSGDPVKIICGDPDAPKGSLAYKGAVESLWNTFGGTITETGHKLLDNHIGLIYGDSITLVRAANILYDLEQNGFASTNVVFGVGSFTYEYATRDNFGFAMKATWGQVNGEGREIFKDPITDSGDKKSAKGLIRVENVDGKLVAFDQQSAEEETQGILEIVFKNGELVREQSLSDIRQILNAA